MLKDGLTACIIESLDDMDAMDIYEDVSKEYGFNPVDNLISSLCEAEKMDILFPTELNSKFAEMLEE